MTRLEPKNKTKNNPEDGRKYLLSVPYCKVFHQQFDIKFKER